MMQSHMRISGATIVLVLALAILGLAGCGGGEEPTPTLAPPTATATAAPTTIQEPTETPTMPPTQATAVMPPASESTIEASQAESPLAAPASPLSAPPSPLAPPSLAPTPVTSADTGGLTGQIIVAKPTGDVAVAGLTIGLAEVIKGEDGMPKASGYEASAAPKATTDDYGRFVFDNLKPGLYTLILDAVVTQYQLDDIDTGDTILVEIQPNTIVDVSQLRYPSLPIPGFQ